MTSARREGISWGFAGSASLMLCLFRSYAHRVPAVAYDRRLARVFDRQPKPSGVYAPTRL
jgi:hypothetical protein